MVTMMMVRMDAGNHTTTSPLTPVTAALTGLLAAKPPLINKNDKTCQKRSLFSSDLRAATLISVFISVACGFNQSLQRSHYNQKIYTCKMRIFCVFVLVQSLHPLFPFYCGLNTGQHFSVQRGINQIWIHVRVERGPQPHRAHPTSLRFFTKRPKTKKKQKRTISPENTRNLYNFASTGILAGLFRKP